MRIRICNKMHRHVGWLFLEKPTWDEILWNELLRSKTYLCAGRNNMQWFTLCQERHWLHFMNFYECLILLKSLNNFSRHGGIVLQLMQRLTLFWSCTNGGPNKDLHDDAKDIRAFISAVPSSQKWNLKSSKCFLWTSGLVTVKME